MPELPTLAEPRLLFTSTGVGGVARPGAWQAADDVWSGLAGAVDGGWAASAAVEQMAKVSRVRSKVFISVPLAGFIHSLWQQKPVGRAFHRQQWRLFPGPGARPTSPVHAHPEAWRAMLP